MSHTITLRLLSNATFGGGAGVPGLVDLEIDHQDGCPQIKARALKGLLREEWEQIAFDLALHDDDPLAARARRVFGTSGATGGGESILRLEDATLPPDLLALLRAQLASNGTEGLTRQQILAALTTIRRQTAVDAVSGAPDPGSLRSVRVLLSGTPLIAAASFTAPHDDDDLAVLAACALGVRRGGSGRNRGRGRLSLLLHQGRPSNYEDVTFTRTCFSRFTALVRGRQEVA